MEIRRINRFVYDVFFGNGWNDWARVRQTRHGVYVVSGQHLSHPTLKYLNDILHPRLPINYGQRLEETILNLSVI